VAQNTRAARRRRSTPALQPAGGAAQQRQEGLARRPPRAAAAARFARLPAITRDAARQEHTAQVQVQLPRGCSPDRATGWRAAERQQRSIEHLLFSAIAQRPSGAHFVLRLRLPHPGLGQLAGSARL
jgi:hypothetical protein